MEEIINIYHSRSVLSADYQYPLQWMAIQYRLFTFITVYSVLVHIMNIQ